MLDDCKTIANLESPSDVYQEESIKKRNRIESRKIEVFDQVKTTDSDWHMIENIIKVTRSRSTLNTKKKEWELSVEISYHISTICLTAQQYNEGIRNHWSIENRNHNVRDNAFQEDKSRIRKKPGIMARLRSWALNLLRSNKVENVSLELYKNALNFYQLLQYKGIM